MLRDFVSIDWVSVGAKDGSCGKRVEPVTIVHKS